MGIKEGLLALLAEGPKHGYQLKVDLEAATGEGVAVNVGQVYSTLQRLERDGLVEVTETDPEGRIVYGITGDGSLELDHWLTTAEGQATVRDEVSMKVLIAIHTGTVDPVEVIDTQRRTTMGALQDYTALKANEESEDLAWRLHLDRLIYNAEAELRWLDRVEERLEEGGRQRSKEPQSQVEEKVR